MADTPLDAPQASSSTAQPVLPSVLPFQPPSFPTTHLSGSDDLVSLLDLRPTYDRFVRPYFRNPKPLVVSIDTAASQQVSDKGKGRVGETMGGKEGGAGGPGPTQATGATKGKGGKKEVDPTVMDLKRFKDIDELVPECLVLPGKHPAIKAPPTSLLQLVMDSTDDMGKPLPSQGIRLRTGLELQGKGWRLAPGELTEAKDPGLFIRQPKPEKKKKKSKRPLPPPDQSIGTGPVALNPLHTTLEVHSKRHKTATPSATPRTPSFPTHTPGTGIPSIGPPTTGYSGAGVGNARTPLVRAEGNARTPGL